MLDKPDPQANQCIAGGGTEGSASSAHRSSHHEALVKTCVGAERCVTATRPLKEKPLRLWHSGLACSCAAQSGGSVTTLRKAGGYVRLAAGPTRSRGRRRGWGRGGGLGGGFGDSAAAGTTDDAVAPLVGDVSGGVGHSIGIGEAVGRRNVSQMAALNGRRSSLTCKIR